MAAIENITAATGRLQTTVDKLVEVWNTPNPTEAAIQAQADIVNQQTDRIAVLVTPPPAPAANPS